MKQPDIIGFGDHSTVFRSSQHPDLAIISTRYSSERAWLSAMQVLMEAKARHVPGTEFLNLPIRISEPYEVEAKGDIFNNDPSVKKIDLEVPKAESDIFSFESEQQDFPATGFSKQDILKLINHISAGVSACHRYQIAHNDVDLGNVLFVKDPLQFWLGDFKTAKQTRDLHRFELDKMQFIKLIGSVLVLNRIKAGEPGDRPFRSLMLGKYYSPSLQQKYEHLLRSAPELSLTQLTSGLIHMINTELTASRQ